MTFICRPALPEDAEPVADLTLEACGDTLRFVLDELAPGVRVRDLLLQMIRSPQECCSYRNSVVAVLDGIVVGVANAFPTDRLIQETANVALTSREIHLQTRTELQDWGSYLLNNIAVHASFRRMGTGLRLIEHVVEQAREEGFDRLSLHVWYANVGARALYRAAGFEVIGHAMVAWHPALPYKNGSLLLRRRLRTEFTSSVFPVPCASPMSHTSPERVECNEA